MNKLPKSIFVKHPLPWMVTSDGDEEVNVEDKNGKYIICKNTDLSFSQWYEIVFIINEYKK